MHTLFLSTFPTSLSQSQPEEEYFVCAWSLDVDTGAPLLLLAGKNGVLLAVNSLTGAKGGGGGMKVHVHACRCATLHAGQFDVWRGGEGR